jgi:hypothetical protein
MSDVQHLVSINSLAAATSQGMPMFLEDWSHVSHNSDVWSKDQQFEDEQQLHCNAACS